MSGRANYEIVKDVTGEPLVIRDVGPWYIYLTVTNAAEQVVEELVSAGRLLPVGRRLFYYDSDNQLDEILVRDGKFAGFEPGPKGGK